MVEKAVKFKEDEIIEMQIEQILNSDKEKIVNKRYQVIKWPCQ